MNAPPFFRIPIVEISGCKAMETRMDVEHAVEELSREHLMVRSNFDRRAWAALIQLHSIESGGGRALVRYCRCCGFMVTEERTGRRNAQKA